jgi:imidazole glycerol-phosphate synthase subunit HisH
LPGRVVKFRFPGEPGRKVPHIGWNQVVAADGAPRERLLDGIPAEAHVYFIHSYHVEPAEPDVVALTCDYGGRFCAAVRRGNLFACQFHPEKSQAVGLKLLDNFVRGEGGQGA